MRPRQSPGHRTGSAAAPSSPSWPRCHPPLSEPRNDALPSGPPFHAPRLSRRKSRALGRRRRPVPPRRWRPAAPGQRARGDGAALGPGFAAPKHVVLSSRRPSRAPPAGGPPPHPLEPSSAPRPEGCRQPSHDLLRRPHEPCMCADIGARHVVGTRTSELIPKAPGSHRRVSVTECRGRRARSSRLARAGARGEARNGAGLEARRASEAVSAAR